MPDDFARFRELYEQQVVPQPVDPVAGHFIQTYPVSELAGQFTHALNMFDVVVDTVSDYTAYVIAKHLLAGTSPLSSIYSQVAMRLLRQPSELLVGYALCLVISGHVQASKEVRDLIREAAGHSERSAKYAKLAEIAIQTGFTPS